MTRLVVNIDMDYRYNGEYVERDDEKVKHGFCPYCNQEFGHDDFEFEHVTLTSTFMEHRFTCSNCGKSGYEVYTICFYGFRKTEIADQDIQYDSDDYSGIYKLI